MDTKIKISIYWLIIGLTTMLHTLFATIGIFFGKNVEVPNATGEIPTYLAPMLIFTMILPFIIAFIQLNTVNKWFKYITFVWSCLLILLNIIHLYTEVFIEKGGIEQIVLLSFVLVVNFFLTKELYKFSKTEKSK